MGETGSTSHLFYNCGVIQISKEKFSDDEILNIAIDLGAKDCKSKSEFHEIISEKEDFFKIKIALERKVDKFIYSGIEWRPLNYIEINNNDSKQIIINLLEELENDDDVQKIFINCKLK